jgi:hypothetical protein
MPGSKLAGNNVLLSSKALTSGSSRRLTQIPGWVRAGQSRPRGFGFTDSSRIIWRTHCDYLIVFSDCHVETLTPDGRLLAVDHHFLAPQFPRRFPAPTLSCLKNYAQIRLSLCQSAQKSTDGSTNPSTTNEFSGSHSALLPVSQVGGNSPTPGEFCHSHAATEVHQCCCRTSLKSDTGQASIV